jgi:hypothetical protein
VRKTRRFARGANAHLTSPQRASSPGTPIIDDKSVAKMGHPVVGASVRCGPPVYQQAFHRDGGKCITEICGLSLCSDESIGGMDERADKESLSATDLEAYIAIAIAILTVVFEMTWQWKVGLLVILTAMLIDMCCRSKLIFKKPWWAKLSLSLIAVGGIVWMSYRPMVDIYIAEEFPESRDNMNGYSLFPFSLEGDPPQVIKGVAEGHITVNGHRIISKKHNYQLIGICFFHLASQDWTFDNNLSKSGLYEIRNSDMEIGIPLTAEFLKELQHGASPSVFVLLAVPRGVGPNQFSTVKEALDLGGKILSEGYSGIQAIH